MKIPREIPVMTLPNATLFPQALLPLYIFEPRYRQMLADALARQAAAHAQAPVGYRDCPGCQQPIACPDASERLVQTRAGEAAWAEPESYCDRCRRSFFPSVQESGH